MTKYKKLLSICLTIILTLSVFSVNTTILAQRNTRHKYVVVTRNHNHTKKHIDKENIHKEHIYKDTSDVIVADMSEYEAEQLEATDEVVAVVEDISLYAHSEESEETLEEQQELWNVQMINAEELTQNEQTVKVGVMDSGINFGDNISVAGNVDFVEEETPFLFPDYSGHGTAVASVISSKNFGVKPNSSMYSIKVIDSSNEALLSNVLSGIYWAIENDIKILNMSFGTATYSPALEQAINDAYNAGILIIASAGNGTEKMYPAGFENVIAVGSLNHKGEVVSENSQHYTNNLLFAPGERVATEGDFGFVQESSGTSFACPHVTAIAAQILEKDQTKTNDFVKSLLFASANTSSGVKVLDAQYALQNYDEFESTYQPTATTPPTLSNTTDLTTFTDVEFEALWGNGAHNTTVTGAANISKLSQKEQDILKVFCRIPDFEGITFQSIHGEVNVSFPIGSNENYYFTHHFANGSGNGTNLYYYTNEGANEQYFEVLDDDLDINFKKDFLLHGRYNYVQSTRYLFDVAKHLWYDEYYKTATEKRQIINNAFKSAYSTTGSDFYGDTSNYSFAKISKSYNSFNGYSDLLAITKIEKEAKGNRRYHNDLRKSLEAMIYLATDCKFKYDSDNTHEDCDIELRPADYPEITTNIDFYTFQRESALKVLGLAIHLLGDTYAHRTIVPNDIGFVDGAQAGNDKSYTIYSGEEGTDFKRSGHWTGPYGIKTLIQGKVRNMMSSYVELSKNANNKALITTHQLRNHWQEVDTDTSSSKGKVGLYEDNINFLPRRYLFAKKTVSEFLIDFFGNVNETNFSVENAVFSADIYKLDTVVENNVTVDINMNNKQRLSDLRRYVHRAGLDSGKPTSYLRFYDSAVSISDIITGTYDTHQEVLELLYLVNTRTDVNDSTIKLSYYYN